MDKLGSIVKMEDAYAYPQVYDAFSTMLKHFPRDVAIQIEDQIAAFLRDHPNIIDPNDTQMAAFLKVIASGSFIALIFSIQTGIAAAMLKTTLNSVAIPGKH